MVMSLRLCRAEIFLNRMAGFQARIKSSNGLESARSCPRESGYFLVTSSSSTAKTGHGHVATDFVISAQAMSLFLLASYRVSTAPRMLLKEFFHGQGTAAGSISRAA